MPFQHRELLQLGLLVLCVPLQYYITGYFDDVKEIDRSQIIIRTMKSVEHLKDNFLNVYYWRDKWQELMVWIFADVLGFELDDGDGESEALEVLAYRKKHGLPPINTKVHEVRPIAVRFRIGQVVQHNVYAYRGIIIGWEYGTKDIEQPIYTVLIDESHLKAGMLSSSMEMEQDKLILLRTKEINHRHLLRYFKAYDGSQYIPQDWLRKIYPKD